MPAAPETNEPAPDTTGDEPMPETPETPELPNSSTHAPVRKPRSPRHRLRHPLQLRRASLLPHHLTRQRVYHLGLHAHRRPRRLRQHSRL